MEQQLQRRDELQAQLIERATGDPTFRRELMADPKGVLERELGLKLPPTLDIRVLEETPARNYLVLPPAPATAGHDLSDQDLQAVAGGWTGGSDCSSCRDTCEGDTCKQQLCTHSFHC